MFCGFGLELRKLFWKNLEVLKKFPLFSIRFLQLFEEKPRKSLEQTAVFFYASKCSDFSLIFHAFQERMNGNANSKFVFVPRPRNGSIQEKLECKSKLSFWEHQ